MVNGGLQDAAVGRAPEAPARERGLAIGGAGEGEAEAVGEAATVEAAPSGEAGISSCVVCEAAAGAGLEGVGDAEPSTWVIEAAGALSRGLSRSLAA